ncbi:uncharacterized protein LOC124268239 [Haliotis rubra]|uniref:uncharacterized protein LOC124268239 n=1 Tax=Haliotis rubra TaxID=36100 RepID=UPI001EE5815A|nr:uncharacterized protein LOC124268239 [Haliotis rubra]
MKAVTQVLLIAMFVIGAFAGEKPSTFKRLFSKEKKEPSYYYDSRKDDYATYKKPGHDDKQRDYYDPYPSEPGYDPYPSGPGYDPYPSEPGYDPYPSEPEVPNAYTGYESELYDPRPANRQVVIEFTGKLKFYGSGRRKSRLLSSMANRNFYY